MRLFSFLLLAAFGLFACKSEAPNNTAAANTTTSASTNTAAAPAPAALAAKLEKLPNVALPITVTPSGNQQFKKLGFDDIEWLQKDFNVQFESETMDKPTDAFRTTISPTRQLVGIMYDSQQMGGRQETNLIVFLLDNSGNAVGTPVNIAVAAALFNQYNAATTEGTVTIEAQQISTATTETIGDPNGEKADEIKKIPAAVAYRISENGFQAAQ